jgi:hypothetical protein
MNEQPANTWKAFYEAAIAFRDLAPWEWMYDTDLFAVQDPDSEAVNYCCIMGNVGEVFALGLYLGHEGFSSYIKLLNMPGDFSHADQVALSLNQLLLKVDFVDKDELTDQDHKQMEASGINLSGEDKWVMARYYAPDHMAMPITEEQAVVLTYALEQATEVAQQYRADDRLLQSEQGHLLLRTAEQKEDFLSWRTEYFEPEEVLAEFFSSLKPNPASIKKVKEALPQQEGAILFMYQYMMSGVMEEGKIVLPRLALWMSYPEGQIIKQEILSPDDGFTKLETSFHDLFHTIKFIPKQIACNSQMGAIAIGALADELAIDLYYAPEEPVFQEITESMRQFL